MVMVDNSEVFLSVVAASLVMGGMITRTTCGKHDAAHELEVGHAECGGRFALALRDAEQTAADDLGDVGAAVQTERDDAGRERIEIQADLRQSEVDDEYLGEQRRPAHEPQIELGRVAKDAGTAMPSSARTRVRTPRTAGSRGS